MRNVAFFLPQFHAFPENDEFWGEGFTEWTNVRRALPQFRGHVPSRVPLNGYYDLKSKDILMAQMRLARSFDIHAFCFYAYWFSGRHVMPKVFDHLRETDSLPIDFVICWANERWSRTWDAAESEVLIEQHHDAAKDADFIDDFADLLRHRNYMRIEGKPVLIIYRSQQLDNPSQTVENMRQRARDLGIGEIYMITVHVKVNSGDPRESGFEAAIQFPPNSVYRGPMMNIATHSTFRGGIWSYQVIKQSAINEEHAEYTFFRGAMPSWDNTPRKLERAAIFIGDTPNDFEDFMKAQWEKTIATNPDDDKQIVFINAWNEWAENAQLEPDLIYKYERLKAVAKAFDYAKRLKAKLMQTP